MQEMQGETDHGSHPDPQATSGTDLLCVGLCLDMGFLDSNDPASSSESVVVYMLGYGQPHAQPAGYPVDRTVGGEKRSERGIPSPGSGAQSSPLVCGRAVAVCGAVAGRPWHPDAAWSHLNRFCLPRRGCPQYHHLCRLRGGAWLARLRPPRMQASLQALTASLLL